MTPNPIRAHIENYMDFSTDDFLRMESAHRVVLLSEWAHENDWKWNDVEDWMQDLQAAHTDAELDA